MLSIGKWEGRRYGLATVIMPGKAIDRKGRDGTGRGET